MGDQQHQKVGEKRPNDHEVENGGASKEPRVDSTDAQIIMVAVEQRNHYREVKATESYAIQSIEGSNGAGSLLKVKDYGNPRKLNVYFNGSDFNDPTTAFQIGRDETQEANFLSYSKNNGDTFYLAVRKCSEMLLRKLKDPPQAADEKYFFNIKKVNPDNPYDSPVTFKSLKTGEYLHCGSTGRVFVKKAIIRIGNEHPDDRETWFKLVPRLQPQEPSISFQKDEVLFAQVETSVDLQDARNVLKDATLDKLNDAEKTNSNSPLENSTSGDTRQKNGDGDAKEENVKGLKDNDYNVYDGPKDTGRTNSKDPKEKSFDEGGDDTSSQTGRVGQ